MADFTYLATWSGTVYVAFVLDAHSRRIVGSRAATTMKTELIRRRSPWKNVDDVELATLEWVDWHNNRRLHTACHDLTPVDYEQVFYGQHPAQRSVGVPTP